MVVHGYLIMELPSRGFLTPRAIFSIDEIEKILAQTFLFSITGYRDRVILETFFAGSIRRGELVKLDLGDVDCQSQLLRVSGKGNKVRYVPISDRACEWLTLYISKIRPKFASIGCCNALFLANNGK
jgi:integrase/recombinase XerD